MGHYRTESRVAAKFLIFQRYEEKLERFIAKPEETVPGNNMKPYGGLASAESRVKLVAFLKTLAADQ